MEEEEVVISSWRRSDAEKEFPEFSGRHSDKSTRNNVGKENVDFNSWRSSTQGDSEDDEITLDDDTLTRVIEGDLREHEDYYSLSRAGSKPKPKPRHKEFSFSDTKDSAHKLFSGTSKKIEKDQNETSPRPVPRPRSKLFSEENGKGSFGSKEEKLLGQLQDSSKITADKLFDSVGKASKSVSFADMSQHQGKSEGNSRVGFKDEHDKKLTTEVKSKRHKASPVKPARTKDKSISVKKGGSVESDESDDIDSKVDSRSPQWNSQRNEKHDVSTSHHPTKNGTGKLFSRQYEGYDEKRNSESKHCDVNDLTKIQDDKDFRKQLGSHVSDWRKIRRDHENSNFSGSKTDKQFVGQDLADVGNNMVSHTAGWMKQNVSKTYVMEGDFGRNSQEKCLADRMSPRQHVKRYQEDFSKEQDDYNMFREHIPVEDGMLRQNGDRNRKFDGTNEGNSKRNTPLKANKRLEEMTKSPDSYNFQYERQTFSGGKGHISVKRSSSLTQLSDLNSAKFEGGEEGGGSLESWRSGSFCSSRDIREAVFNEWLERKQNVLKEKSKKKKEEVKKEKDKLKEKREKQLSAKKAFEVWSARKEEVIKGQAKKKKEAIDKETETKREKILKQQDAKKFFESWKSKKDELLKENYKEKRTKEMEEKKKIVEDKREKTDIAKKSYDKWKARKEEQLKGTARNKRKDDMMKTKYEKEMEIEKRQENEKNFQEFLRKKGTGKRAPPSPSLTQRPWCPGGLTRKTNLIPEKIQPVISTPTLNRSRSFTGMSGTAEFRGSNKFGKRW